MKQQLGFLLLATMLLPSCSLYSSAGRKQFEEKAPASIITQGFSLRSCRNLSSAEAWIREEFPSRSSELIEMNQDYEVWNKLRNDGSIEVSVLTKHDSGEGDTPQMCVYEFVSREAWIQHKNTFLQDLSNSLVDLN